MNTPMPDRPAASRRRADAALVAGLVLLAGLLGATRVRDFDVWWHLRTGQIIRAERRLPTTDWFTFTAANDPWIDGQWGSQVVASLLYDAGGIEALNGAKAVAVALAVGLLAVGTIRGGGPARVVVIGWMPGLLLLSTRMVVRPEVVTIVALAIDLAIIAVASRRPRLAWLLPIVQLAWVNAHGLFVLGPFVVTLAALFPPRSADRRRTHRHLAGAAVATILACFATPYGLAGTSWPLALWGTLADPVFRRTIEELAPLPLIVERAGWSSPLVIVTALAFLAGLLSFVMAASRRRFDPFRLVLFVVFAALGGSAARNLGLFALIAGAVTSANLADWASATIVRPSATRGRIAAGLTLASMIAATLVGLPGWVAGDGRTFGLGEEPLVFAHEAAELAGADGMPRRAAAFHIGQAAVYAFHNGPDRRVMADPRLEVLGPRRFADTLKISTALALAEPGWESSLRAAGNPLVLIDHGESVAAGPVPAHPGATLLANPGWRCVGFDPVAAVFVTTNQATSTPTIDFAARLFRPTARPPLDPSAEAAAEARALLAYALTLRSRGQSSLADPLIALGIRRAREGGPEALGTLGQLWLLRVPPPPTGARPAPDRPLDPVVDLPIACAAAALRRAADEGPRADRFAAIGSLSELLAAWGFAADAAAALERLLALAPAHPGQAALQARARRKLADLRREAARNPLPKGIDQNSFGFILWDAADLAATIHLRRGQPGRARAFWQTASGAEPQGRAGLAALAQGEEFAAEADLIAAAALSLESFEIAYAMAALYRDLGQADDCIAAADQAIRTAPDPASADAARAIRAAALPFATPKPLKPAPATGR